MTKFTIRFGSTRLTPRRMIVVGYVFTFVSLLLVVLALFFSLCSSPFCLVQPPRAALSPIVPCKQLTNQIVMAALMVRTKFVSQLCALQHRQANTLSLHRRMPPILTMWEIHCRSGITRIHPRMRAPTILSLTGCQC